LQLAGIEGLFEGLQEQAPEQSAKYLGRQEEILSAGDPTRSTRRETAASDNNADAGLCGVHKYAGSATKGMPSSPSLGRSHSTYLWAGRLAAASPGACGLEGVEAMPQCLAVHGDVAAGPAGRSLVKDGGMAAKRLLDLSQSSWGMAPAPQAQETSGAATEPQIGIPCYHQ
jgi:hypothetical protein